jgi:hypothetical protein
MSRRQAAASAHRDASPAKAGFLRETHEFGKSARRQIRLPTQSNSGGTSVANL